MKSFHPHDRRLLALGAAALLVSLACTQSAKAQLFGNRTLGAPLSISTGPGAPGQANLNPAVPGAAGAQATGNQPTVGTLRSDQRFIRGNRRATDFVGASEDRPGFVGASQAAPAGPVRSAVTAAPAPPPRVNRVPTASASQNRPYDPKLRIDFEHPVPDAAMLTARLSAQLTEALDRSRIQGQVQLEVQDSTVVLIGTVASSKQRALAEQLVRLEPGVMQVRNELQLAPAAGR